MLLLSGTGCPGKEKEPCTILGLQSAIRLVYRPTEWDQWQYMVGGKGSHLQICNAPKVTLIFAVLGEEAGNGGLFHLPINN